MSGGRASRARKRGDGANHPGEETIWRTEWRVTVETDQRRHPARYTLAVARTDTVWKSLLLLRYLSGRLLLSFWYPDPSILNRPAAERLLPRAPLARVLGFWTARMVNPEHDPSVPLATTLASTTPRADPARNAIHAIRGYEYQALAAALAWIDLDDDGLLYLEVAEDYAEVIDSAINAVQVKDTRSSGPVTLNTADVRNAIASFIDLTERNPSRPVQLRFLTTSAIGLERSNSDRPGGLAGLTYWQRVRSGQEDVGKLREILERERYPDPVRRFCARRSNTELCQDLIRRITWDCGSPDATNLRRELEQRLILVMWKQFRIPSQEAPRIADTLAYRVLRKSALPEAQERVLSRAELHQLIDSSTRLSIPRATLERILEGLVADMPETGAGQAAISSPSSHDPQWLIDASGVPTPRILVARSKVEAAVQSALKSAGVCFIFGTTGVGKSMVARAIGSRFPGGVRWIDSRHADYRETHIRLNQALSLLAGMGPSTLMVEDMNSIEEPTVQIALAQVIEAAHRHDMRVLITCYRRPSAAALNGLGLDSVCVVACPHFDQEETNALVKCAGGDPARWGRVAYLAGGTGHPQLTHAFVVGMAAKDWPETEIMQVVADGFTSADLKAAREVARANLIIGLPEPARDLLYRLSITTLFFKRTLALAIGAMSPSVPRAGECFDQLVGRWVDVATPGRYRLSPLAYGLGREMLTAEEQHQIHHIIATQILQDSPIDAGDIDTILVHGLAGDSQNNLWTLSHLVNTADYETREVLGKHLIAFRLLDTSKPIYPKNLPTSVMLRLAQLRLVAVSDEPERTADVASALLHETDTVPDDLAGPYLEIAVVGSILNNLGIANHIRGWVGVLSRFLRLHHVDDDALSPRKEHAEISSTAAAMFNIGIAGLDSVSKLAMVFQELAALHPSERRILLTPIDPNHADYQVIVQHPWVTESRQPDFDAASAAASYERMARDAQAWGERTLSLQCSVALTAILDEQLGDFQAALRVLNYAQASHGKDLILARAFAKLHHKNGEHAEALLFYRDTVPHVEAANPVGAVYTIRDGAVCAATCGEWDTARSWFLRAQAAAGALQNIGLDAIRIGLGADAAVASFEIGDLQDALRLLRDAMVALGELDPHSNLQAAHCHRVLRHTILWLQAKVEGRDTKVQGEPIAIIPGACSNPEPVREIEQHPLGHIDFAWYMLAELETTSGLDLGIRANLTQLTAKGHIPVFEHSLRLHVLGTDIERLDSAKFARHLPDYVASAVYCLNNASVLREGFDPMDPQKVLIPTLSGDGPFDADTERVARQALLAYGVRSLFNGQLGAIFELGDALAANLGQSYPGKSLFDNWNAPAPGRTDLDSEIAAILPPCLKTGRPPPDLLFLAGLRLLDWITQSQFKTVLIPHLAPWLRGQWQRVIQTQRFGLHAPASTVPAIEAVLKSQSGREQFAAKLALVADVAVQARLGKSLREHLSELARKSPD